jgi:uncharacterized protein YjdB
MLLMDKLITGEIFMKKLSLIFHFLLMMLLFVSCSGSGSGSSGTDNSTADSEDTSVVTIRLNKAATTILAGGSELLSATLDPSDVIINKTTWSSSDTSVASVDMNGLVTGVSSGEAAVSVILPDKKKSAVCHVTVSGSAVSVQNISLNTINAFLNVGSSMKIFPSISPLSATNQNIIWSSSDTTIARVDADGTVTGFSAGNAAITATAMDCGKTAVCNITVTTKMVAAEVVTLNHTNASIRTGGVLQLTPIINPRNATDQNVKWASSDENVVTVSSAGQVYGVSPGKAIVSVTTDDGGYSTVCRVTVVGTAVPVTGIKLNVLNAGINKDGTIQLEETVTPAEATNHNVVWTSSNTSVAAVTSGGLVTGLSEGETTITVRSSDGGYAAACTVTVVLTKVPVTGIDLETASLTINVNEQGQLVAAAMPEDATNRNLIWSTSNNRVASVNSTGLVTGVYAGNAIITVKTEDGGYASSCPVTVKNGTNSVTGISLDRATMDITQGVKFQLNAVITPSWASDKRITWWTSDYDIAEVSTGLVTAGFTDTGKVRITAATHDGDYRDYCIFTVVRPSVTGTYDTPGIACDVCLSGNYAYVADDESGLQIIDVSNPANPILAGTYSTTGAINSVFVSGNHAYATDDYNGLLIIDVSNPASPVLEGSYSPSGASRVHVSGNYAYLVRGCSLDIIDISKPSNPFPVKVFNWSDYVYGIFVSGNHAYVSRVGAINIINVADPINSYIEGSYSYPDEYARPYDLCVSGNYAYVANYYDGLQMIDVSNPASPVLCRNLTSSNYSKSVFVSGNYLYYINTNLKYLLNIANISDPLTPYSIRGCEMNNSYAVCASGNYVYVADGFYGLRIVYVPVE